MQGYHEEDSRAPIPVCMSVCRYPHYAACMTSSPYAVHYHPTILHTHRHTSPSLLCPHPILPAPRHNKSLLSLDVEIIALLSRAAAARLRLGTAVVAVALVVAAVRGGLRSAVVEVAAAPSHLFKARSALVYSLS
jgi:hypothetical protein